MFGIGRINAAVVDADKTTRPADWVSGKPRLRGWRDVIERWFGLGSRNFRHASRSYRYLARQIEADLPHAELTRRILVSSQAPLERGNDTLLMFSYFMRDELGCRILLVDGTFREDGVGARLGYADAPGFLDLLYGKAYRVGELIRPTQRRGISVLPAGAAPLDRALPLQSGRVCEILEEAQGDFDYVLFQQASILEDSRYVRCALGADLVLLVIEEGVTLLDELDRCKQAFRDHQIPNVRVLLSTSA